MIYTKYTILLEISQTSIMYFCIYLFLVLVHVTCIPSKALQWRGVEVRLPKGLPLKTFENNIL